MDADTAPADVNSNVKSLLDRLHRPGSARVGQLPDPDHEEPEYRAYAHGRVGNRPQLTLIFSKADGSLHAFNYLQLFAVTSDNPHTGFQIEFSGQRIRLVGQNLEPLFRLVCQHKAAEIVEARQSQALAAGNTAPVVERIELIDGLRR